MNRQFVLSLIEDDAVLSKSLSDALAEAGFVVHHAYDGEEGILLVQRVRPDLILLDIMLPKVDGFTLLQRFKTDSTCNAIPIIVLTQFDLDDTMLKKISQYEPAHYLVKSRWKADDIVKKVQGCLGVV